MIPFTIPQDHEVINLGLIVRMEEMDNGSIEVIFADGASRCYDGKAAAIVKGGVMRCLELFHSAIKATNGGGIVVEPASRIM